MEYFILVILTVGSCVLFEYSKLNETLKSLITSYKLQFKVISDKDITDEIKQKKLMQLISNQLKLIGKLIFGIVLFISPFLSLFLLEKLDRALNPDILVTWWGLLIPMATVLLYLLIKRNYGKLFNNR